MNNCLLLYQLITMQYTLNNLLTKLYCSVCQLPRPLQFEDLAVRVKKLFGRDLAMNFVMNEAEVCFALPYTCKNFESFHYKIEF